MSCRKHPIRMPAALAAISLLLAHTAWAQGGREFLEWLKEYSPTGYFIITDGEARAKEPGWHKQWLDNQTLPLPAVAVHETCHLRDGALGSDKTENFYVGDFRDYKVTADFTPFSSKEMMPDIPASLENFQTDVYISGKAGTNAYSMVGGLIGIYGEWDAYLTDLKSSVEMAACFKAHFNSRSQWNALAGNGTSGIMSAPEFRYFCLRYILWAKKKYPDIYARITTGKAWREAYTLLALWEEKVSAEWIAVLTAAGLDTKSDYGFDDYWKFRNELQKTEYKDLEKIMMVSTVGIAPYLRRTPPVASSGGKQGPLFDLQGRLVRGNVSPGVLFPSLDPGKRNSQLFQAAANREP